MNKHNSIHPVSVGSYRDAIYLYVSGGNSGSVYYNCKKQEVEAHKSWINPNELGMTKVKPEHVQALEACRINARVYERYLDRVFDFKRDAEHPKSLKKHIGSWNGIDITKEYRILMWDYAIDSWMNEPTSMTMLIHEDYPGITKNVPTAVVQGIKQEELF